ncbi:hypothetical protein ANAEL_01764 [Anaerolineales bacterium]|nr:hypothetical protein ANAEL_01764 [Anaerolineales bacterium]
MNIPLLGRSEKALFTLLVSLIIIGSCVDFFDIAQGTGVWMYGFAFTWFLIFLGYCVFSLFALLMLVNVIWRDQVYKTIVSRILSFRSRVGNLRWLLALLFLAFPVWFFQFTVWGIVFYGLFVRLLIWLPFLFFFSVFITDGEGQLIDWKRFLAGLVLNVGVFLAASALKFVSGYPFSLGWSEGNRLWDYSIMFGRDRYDYPPDQDIFVLLETGRQFVGGIPFLISGITIRDMRAWIGLLGIFPYLLLGFALFRSVWREKWLWVVLSLWTYLILNQGPINPSLILGAVLVALAWRSSLWISIPLVFAAGYFVNISRFTWIFAPAIWLAMLELSSAELEVAGRLRRETWVRVFILFGSGLIGGVFLPVLIKFLQTGSFANISFGGNQVAVGDLSGTVSQQSLLWYRLLPNSTYEPGILLGLLVAAAPLTLILYYLVSKKYWKMNAWQMLSIVVPLLAFLAVGFVVSAKIGGGGDLHNLDMFLIALVFSLAVAWDRGGRQWLESVGRETVWVKALIVASVIIPALVPLQEMRSYSFGDKASWLVGLTDVPNERALDMYPSQSVIDDTLKSIQNEIDKSVDNGEILFIDQRQLLTFGFVKNVPLVPDYDKKVLIERALASNRDYFQLFYKDLADKRFSLIISQPLNTPRKGSGNEFGEENNAWVKWVADPLLCYYQVKQTFLDAGVQLLAPKEGDLDCADELP